MKGYESVIITDPDLTEEEMSGLLDKVKDTITSRGGQVHQYHLWGRRRLAYLINKKSHGVYHIFYLTGDGTLLNVLNQYYRYSENILRFQTIKVENIQEESERFLELKTPSATPTTQSEEKNEKTNEKEKNATVKAKATAAETTEVSEERAPEPEAITANEEEK